MKLLPTIRKFEYDGVRRVVIEKGVDIRANGKVVGMKCLEVEKDGKKSNKVKTFKPEKMMDSQRCGLFETLKYTLASVRVG